ncbi:MAG: PIN domain-containing protein [Nocardioidaceae bacterium]
MLFTRRRRGDHRRDEWVARLLGRRIVISFQTGAEVLAGAVAAGWGDRTLRDLRRQLDDTPTIHESPEVTDSYATLTACKNAGHPLHGKIHTGDRWIAACAITLGLRLLAGDSIYADTPGLSRL